MDNEFFNRIKKNSQRLKSYLKSEKIEAYRLYDKDIPDFPYIVDIYRNYAVVYEKGKKGVENEIRNDKKQIIQESLKTLFKEDFETAIFKERKTQSGKNQYERISNKEVIFDVKEGAATYRVNLTSYLDTGLFLDHRPLRKLVWKESRGKDVLNLFSYTGSISVMAALGGATNVVSVDLSNTYQNWAKENFEINKLNVHNYEFLVNDVFDFLKDDNDSYDLIILDPPTFSNSKKMEDILDIDRDHPLLIELAVARLREGGRLYFSTNRRKFKLEKSILDNYQVVNITEKTIPQDVRDPHIHQCFIVSKKL